MKKLFTFIAAATVALATMATTYTGTLSVTINGGDPTTQDDVTITIDQNGDAYDLSLSNLILDGMPVGSINLDGLTATTSGKVAMLYAYENVHIAEGDLEGLEGSWMGPMLGAVPIRMSARIYDNSVLAVNIDIDMMNAIEQIINVSFVSNNFDVFQIPNGDFEDWKASSGEPDHWHGFKSAKGSLASAAKGTLGSDTGRSGNCAVATSGTVFGVVNNGTFTNGQLQAGSMSAANTANHSEMDKTSTATDKNGDPYYTALAAKPDALQLWYKFTQGTAQTTYKYASVSAITFDGSYYQDPEDKTYTNVAAKAKKTDITTTTTWTELNIPFVYENADNSEAILITVSTNATPGKGSSGDKIYVDDMKLVYNLPSVTDITKDGATIAGFDAETKDYVFEIGIDEVLTASQFAATIEGAAAGILDIRVNEIPGGLGYEVAVCAISGDLALNKYTLTYLRPTTTLAGIVDGDAADRVVVGDALGIAMIDGMPLMGSDGMSVYAADEAGNWVRLQLTEAQDVTDMSNPLTGTVIAAGKLAGSFNGNALDPAITVTGFEKTGLVEVPVEIKDINLANSFDLPVANQVVKLTGVYSDGKLRGYTQKPQGQSIDLDFGDSDAASRGFVEGAYVSTIAAISMHEAWSGAPRRANSSYDYDFQNLVAKVLTDAEDATTTGVEDITTDAEVVSTRYYNVEGRQIAEPAQGVTIVVTTHSDGTVKATKVLK
ncbi:MAG: hypothetical protein IJU62_02865 [Muribaculaceae bacterium]|nr:hypothetical protein [Muribaculaceae bacterium]